jgi:hypothetical protein
MSISQQAKATYRAVKHIKADSGSGCHMYHMATELRCHSIAPPPVEQYEEWLASAKSSDPRGKTSLTGMKLRRAVIAIRNGCSQTEAARAVGLASAGALNRWLQKLPLELAA